MNRLALYIRVSTEEQAVHGLSVEAQTECLEEWAKKNGEKISGIYVDAGVSARKKVSKRPELQRLLADVTAGNVDLIVFTKLDRWFRNIGEYYKVQEILDDHHVGWKAIHEDYDTTTASGRLKVNIMLSVAQDEADRTAERIKAVFDEKKKNLEPVTGNVPYGYKIIGKKIEIDPDRKDEVIRLFDTFLSTGSIHSATEGVRIYYRLADSMLKNPAYYGEFNGTDGMCPPYISKEQFSLIQSMRKARPRTPKDPNRIYIFSGVLFCGDCGDRMAARAQKSRHEDGTFTECKWYQCNRHWRYGVACPNGSCMGEKRIEKEALRQLPVALMQMNAEFKIKSKNSESDAAALQSEKKKMKRLQELYINDLIGMEEYKSRYDAISSEIERLSAEKQKPPAASEILKANWRELYDGLDDTHKRAFWLSVTQKITISHDKTIRVILR